MNTKDVFEKYCGTIEDDKKAAMNWQMLTLEQFEKALADYEAAKWISGEVFPELIEGENYSENVLAEVEGCNEVQVMCAFKSESGIVWANCYGYIYRDGYHDDDYKVIRWTRIPQPPKK